MNKDYLAGILGILIILSSFFTLGSITYDQFGLYTSGTRAIIKECEKDLPRNQKCVLIAIPEELK